jgi:formylglycine-generating enzyme required for sulfatase activity
MQKTLSLIVVTLIFSQFIPVSLLAGKGDEVSKPYKPLVAQISTEFSIGEADGFGFIVGERDSYFYIVTANHVVRAEQPDNPTEKVWLRFSWDPGGKRQEAELLASMHGPLDLALLRIARDRVFGADRVSWGEQAYCEEWVDEELVWFIGRQKKWYVPSDRRAGVMLGTEADLQGIVHFDINSIKPGSSGAPLIVERGIVGMVTKDAGDEARAVNIDLVRRFVSKNNPYPWNLIKCGTVSPEPKPKPEPSKKPIIGDTITEKITGMQLAYAPTGCFKMGSSAGGPDGKPVHEVCVDGYWIGKHEVTQGQWRTIMDNNPTHVNKGDNYPVKSVSWDLAQLFISKLNEKSGRQFRLPTEAEWEYACRANGKGEYCGGDNIGDLAWYRDNSRVSTYPVGVKQANGFDIKDMSSNVLEWCQDWYGEDYYSISPRHNPQGPSSGSDRVIRGGGRDFSSPGSRHHDIGFRLVLPPGQ